MEAGGYMNSTKDAARRAGLLYLIMSIPAPFTLIYIPSFFMGSGNAAATVDKIRTSEFLFRVGIVGALIGWILFILGTLALSLWGSSISIRLHSANSGSLANTRRCRLCDCRFHLLTIPQLRRYGFEVCDGASVWRIADHFLAFD